MVKKIIELSKIFVKDYFQKLNIFNEDKKLNKKSIFTWLIIILIIAICFLSYKIINWLDLRGQAILFLKIYLPIIATIFMFQAILICTNVFFFSKDLEHILPLPIKPIELLIAKFNNVIIITYMMELLFLALPLLIYGLIAVNSIFYFLTMILVLIIFPIFLITIISLIMLFVMQLTKFIKNKDLFQILISIILSLIICLGEGYLINTIFNDNMIKTEINQNNEIETVQINNKILHNKLDKLNNYLIIINPCISLLTNIKMTNIIWQLIKLIFICTISCLIFIICGKKLYLNNLLKNIAYINKRKNNKKIIKNKYEKKSIKKSYIKYELKKLIKNPTFFTQCIFQYIFYIGICLLIINLFMPTILASFEEQNILQEMGKDNFTLQAICIILSIIQILFTLNNLSLTAISREGKDAIVMKYIPVSLYKQFIWKATPSILINTIAIIAINFVIGKNISEISIWYYVITTIIAMFLNIINSFLMLIVDLKKPNLDWTTETSPIKNNANKLYQYVTTIIIILILSYLTKVLYDVNILISLAIIFIKFLIILILINFYTKKKINKLFEKIQ